VTGARSPGRRHPEQRRRHAVLAGRSRRGG
jgi:hypothetical protein